MVSANGAEHSTCRKANKNAVFLEIEGKPHPLLMPRAGLEPARPYGQRIFLPLRLSPPEIRAKGRIKSKDFKVHYFCLLPFYFCLPFGSWSGRCLLHASLWMFRREPSRLYTLPILARKPALARRCHQRSRYGPVKVSPNLTPFTQQFPDRRAQNSLSPQRLPIPPPRHMH